MIIDEIHAVIGTRRGSHLSLSLERLEHIVHQLLLRIGLSATQKPIELVADYLTGGTRNRGGKKVPPQLQRTMADDLMAAVFPDAAACFENIGGDRTIPDHPLVNHVPRAAAFLPARRRLSLSASCYGARRTGPGVLRCTGLADALALERHAIPGPPALSP